MSTVTSVLVASLAASFALVVVAWRRDRDPRRVLGLDVDDLTWDFSKSWGSNLTLVGAVLSTVLAAKILPMSQTTPATSKTVLATPDDYTALGLVFGILVVLAPFVFVALRKGDLNSKGKAEYHGFGWTFLLASFVTLAGVIGELVTVGLLFFEAHHGKVIALGVVIPVWIALGAGLALAFWYAFKTIPLTLSSLHAIKGKPRPKPAAEGGAGMPTEMFEREDVGEVAQKTSTSFALL